MEQKDFVYEQYKLAITTRNLEIDLFWRRSLFFAGFISAAFVGYHKIDEPTLKISIAMLGLFLSVAWFFANKGSKYWYESWEAKVSAVEELLEGAFPWECKNDAEEHCNYKIATRLFRYCIEENKSACPFVRGSMRSVSKLTISISFAVAVSWIVVIVNAFTKAFDKNIKHNEVVSFISLEDATILMYIIFMALFIIFLFSLSKSGGAPHKHLFRFHKDKIVFAPPKMASSHHGPTSCWITKFDKCIPKN